MVLNDPVFWISLTVLGAGLSLMSARTTLGITLVLIGGIGLTYSMRPLFLPGLISFHDRVGASHPLGAFLAVTLTGAAVGALLFGGGWWFLGQIQATPNPSVPTRLKIVQPAQFLPDQQGGIYIVIPDVQLTNSDTTATVINIELLVEKDTGAFIHLEPSASRIPDIERWLTDHGLADSNFLGRQINLSPQTGINGYMVFYADELVMSNIPPGHLPYLPLSFRIEQLHRSPRTLSIGEAIIGH